MGVVGQNTISTFTSPVNGTSPIDANTVKGNDNTIKTAFNLHDSDGTIHFQDSLASARPAAGTAGRKWLDNDTLRVYYDNGSVWQEIAYITSAGGTFTGPILLANGSVGAPSLAFANDTDCGLYRIGANNLGLAVNGTKILDIGTTGLALTGGFVASGNANFGGAVELTTDAAEVTTTYAGVTTTRLKTDSTGGLLSVDGANPLRLRNNGTDRLTVLANGNVVTSGAVGVASYVEVGTTPATTGALRLENTGQIVARNSANTSNIGLLYLDSSDVLQLRSDTGSARFGGAVTTAGLASFGSDLNLVATASIGTSSNGDWYLKSNAIARWLVEKSGAFLAFADNTSDIGASGANRPRTGYFGTSVIAPTFTGDLTGNVSAPDGTVGAPSVAFTNDTDCGLYRIGANNLGLALNGVKVVDFKTSGIGIPGHFSAMGTSISVDAGLNITGAINGTGAQQQTIFAGGSASSSATTSSTALQTRPGTDAAAFTCASVYGVFAQDAQKGAGSTITTQYGLYVDFLTAGTTNYSIYTNTGKARFGDEVLTSASTTARASLNIPHGTAPTSPVDGDLWTTTAGLFVRINGVTVGPLT